MSCVVITATTLWCLLLRPLCPAMAAASAEDRPQTVEQWREDIDFFARELPARHFEFYQLIPRERFEREISRLRRELPNLEDAEIILRLRRIVAELHVAHTHISLGPGLGAHAFHSYPVRFRWFSDGLVVTAATPEYQRALGCRVVRIGSKSPVQVERIVSPYISYENETHLHRASARCMSLVELMQREKVVGPDAHMQLTCMPVSGPPFTLDIPPRGEPADAEESIDLLEAPGSAEDPVEPVGARLVRIEKTLHIPKGFARSRRGAYWYAYLPDTQTLYIQYNHCRNAPDETFQDFTNRVFAFADRRSVRRVVVDLRFNGGGSSSVFAPMVGALRSRPALTTRGRLYALIGPGTFSAAVFAVRDLRDGLNAILVGEPTGNKPNHYGQVQKFVLPNSKLSVTFATKHFHLVRNGDPPAYEPDVAMPQAFRDFLDGRDRALEFALGGKNPAQSDRAAASTDDRR